MYMYNESKPTNVTESWEIITPEYAKSILKNHNKNNRPISNYTVQKYISDMVNGKWDIASPDNHIDFYNDGDVANGQHRLMAIAVSGVSVPMLVRRGYERGTIIDNGRSRKISDQLKIDGMDVGSRETSCIRYILERYGITSVTKNMVSEYYQIHGETIKKAMRICDKRDNFGKKLLLNSPTSAALYFALLNSIPEDVLNKFVSVATSLKYENENEYSAVLVYQFVVDSKTKLHRGITSDSEMRNRHFSIVCQAIRDFNSKKQRKRAYTLENVDFMLNVPRHIDRDFISKYKR